MKFFRLNILTSSIIKSEKNLILYIELILFFVLIVMICSEQILLESYLKAVIYPFIIGYIGYLKAQTLKRMVYSFWGLAAVQLYLIMYVMLTMYSVNFLLYLSLSSLLLLFMQAYLLSSPMYYPRVRWWEYDFRYRGELKIIIDNLFSGRLTDLRRGAGCIVSFENLLIGKSYSLKAIDIESGDLTFEVLTVKEPNIGRGKQYGVKFVLKSDQEKKQYSNLLKSWRKESKARLRRKFEE